MLCWRIKIPFNVSDQNSFMIELICEARPNKILTAKYNGIIGW